MVRAIVFDAVGTLIHAEPPVADVYHLAGWQHGSQLTRDEVGQRLRAAFAAAEAGEGLVREATSESRERERWRGIVAAVFDDVPQAAAAIYDGLWRHFAQAESWRTFDDAAATLAELSERGYRLAVASNFDRRLRRIVQADPSLRRIERCFISSEIGYPKPDARFFQAASEQLGLAPAEILLVGDDWTNDILGARAAGWQTVWLARKATQSAEPHIGSLSELLAQLPREVR